MTRKGCKPKVHNKQAEKHEHETGFSLSETKRNFRRWLVLSHMFGVERNCPDSSSRARSRQLPANNRRLKLERLLGVPVLKSLLLLLLLLLPLLSLYGIPGGSNFEREKHRMHTEPKT